MSANVSVLVVDDNRDYCEVVAAILRRDGFAVDICSSTSEAIEQAQAHSYAAIILEPSPSAGVEPVFGYLLQSRSEALPHVVVATTENDDEVLARFQRHGVFRILRKPLSREVLSMTVTECCRAQLRVR